MGSRLEYVLKYWNDIILIALIGVAGPRQIGLSANIDKWQKTPEGEENVNRMIPFDSTTLRGPHRFHAIDFSTVSLKVFQNRFFFNTNTYRYLLYLNLNLCGKYCRDVTKRTFASLYLSLFSCFFLKSATLCYAYLNWVKLNCIKSKHFRQ